MDSELLALARQQHGLLTMQQWEAAGELPRLRRRLTSCEWVEEQPGVLRPSLLEPGFAMRVAAVRLALADASAGSWCFSHLTAARLMGLAVPWQEPLDVLLPMSRRKLALRGVRRHFTESMFRVMWLGCEPVPFVPRAVLQCATQLARDDLLHLVESSVRAGRTDLPRLRVAGGRGFSGSAALRSALDELSAEGLDRWVRRVVRRLVAAGLPRPALEVPVPDGRRIRAYLDGYWAEAQLALEVDDWETHGSREAQERDRRRDRWLLNSYGIVTVRITPREIRDRPDEVVADIVQAYRRRRGGSSEPAGPVTSGNALIRAS